MRSAMTSAARLALLALCVAAGCPGATPDATAFPVLAIRRGAGDDALAQHTLTAREQALFQAMNDSIGPLPKDAPEAAYREAIVAVGARFGLSAGESIAFYTRTFFSIFEPDAR